MLMKLGNARKFLEICEVCLKNVVWNFVSFDADLKTSGNYYGFFRYNFKEEGRFCCQSLVLLFALFPNHSFIKIPSF